MSPRGCPCGLPEPYPVCCGRFHAGDGQAPTAELLVRSRYTAFVVGDPAYLLRTWDPGTRPADLPPDPERRWTGLEILDTTAGGLFDAAGTVEFRASYVLGWQPGAQQERSRFRRVDGAWVYVDGVRTGSTA